MTRDKDKVTESCSCGASVTVEAAPATIPFRLKEWREQHHHTGTSQVNSSGRSDRAPAAARARRSPTRSTVLTGFRGGDR